MHGLGSWLEGRIKVIHLDLLKFSQQTEIMKFFPMTPVDLMESFLHSLIMLSSCKQLFSGHSWKWLCLHSPLLLHCSAYSGSHFLFYPVHVKLPVGIKYKCHFLIFFMCIGSSTREAGNASMANPFSNKQTNKKLNGSPLNGHQLPFGHSVVCGCQEPLPFYARIFKFLYFVKVLCR